MTVFDAEVPDLTDLESRSFDVFDFGAAAGFGRFRRPLAFLLPSRFSFS